MRTLKHLALIAAMSGLFLLNSCKSLEFPIAPSAVEITLKVDAAAIFNLEKINNKNQIERHCTIEEDRDGSTRSSGDVKNFVTAVITGDDITWNAVSTSDDYTVTIDNVSPRFTRSSQKNLFKDFVLKASGGNVNRVVQPPSSSESKRIYPYTIYFSISNGEETKSYFVDPKLKAI